MDPASAGMPGLSAVETRRRLLEKQRTTPEQYPLSLNALRLACNQSTNRDPVVDYDEATIRDALHRLERRKLVRCQRQPRGEVPASARRSAAAAGGRASGPDRVCCCAARKRRAPEQRAERMHAFADLAGVHMALEQLIGANWWARLDRRPGQKEERYEQLLQGRRRRGGGRARLSAPRGWRGRRERGEAGLTAPSPSAATSAPSAADEPRPDAAELQELRERVELLEREVAGLPCGDAQCFSKHFAAPHR